MGALSGSDGLSLRVPCPLIQGLEVGVVRLDSPGNEWLWRAGELVEGDDGLYVVFVTSFSPSSPSAAVRVAVWCPRLGWRESRSATPSLGPMSSLAAVAAGRPDPPGGLSGWLDGLLSDPASLFLALDVMTS